MADASKKKTGYDTLLKTWRFKVGRINVLRGHRLDEGRTLGRGGQMASLCMHAG